MFICVRQSQNEENSIFTMSQLITYYKRVEKILSENNCNCNSKNLIHAATNLAGKSKRILILTYNLKQFIVQDQYITHI